MNSQLSFLTLKNQIRENPLLRRRVFQSLILSSVAIGSGYVYYNYLSNKHTYKKLKSHSKEAGVEASDENDQDQSNKSQTKSEKSKQSPKSRKKGIKSVLELIKLLLFGREKRNSIPQFLSLIILAIIRTSLSNRLAKVQGFLFRAAFLKNPTLFSRLILENLLLCFIQSSINSTLKFLKSKMSLKWRKVLTDRIHDGYFKHMVYYKLSHVDDRVEYPEQILSNDIPKFCSDLSELIQDDVFSLFDAVFYTYKLCSYTHPKYALGILGYVLLAGGISNAFSPPFGKILGKEQQLESEYRHLHSRFMQNSESIAFYNGHATEHSIIRNKFYSLVQHAYKTLFIQWRFSMLQDFILKYFGATWAVVLIIGPFFGQKAFTAGSESAPGSDSGLVGRGDMLSNMRYHTSVVITLFQAVGSIASSVSKFMRLSGYSSRISNMLSVMKDLKNENSSNTEKSKSNLKTEDFPNNEKSNPNLKYCSSPVSNSFIHGESFIEFKDVSIVTPSQNVLVKNLNLKINPGCNLLITGPNGSGKSSLFRVLGGLWNLSEGKITKPGNQTNLNDEIFYVPQKPYTAIGTLKDLLIYPLVQSQLKKEISKQTILQTLSYVDLQHLVDRFGEDEEVNWEQELSLGEIQRLGMARLFFHSPKFAILDECTSAVTMDMEQKFCSLVHSKGITCVTISHRPALVDFHQKILALDGEGGWSVHIKDGNPESVSDSNEENSEIKTVSERKEDASLNALHYESNKFSDERLGSAYTWQIVQSSPSPSPFVPDLRLKLQNPKLIFQYYKLLKIMIPKVLGAQGGKILGLFFLVFARTLLSDRIASLNGSTVDYVIQQNKSAFIRLIFISIFQSLVSAVIAPSMKYISALLALNWRQLLTNDFSQKYFYHNTFYRSIQFSDIENIDQRMTNDVSVLCKHSSDIILGFVKPFFDILWFTWKMRCLTGRRGIGILYSYMFLGFGFLKNITPDFASLTMKEQHLEASFRFMHSRLRIHAESIAFFGGGEREKEIIEKHFHSILEHSHKVVGKQYLFSIFDDFISKQLPHNVTWMLSFLYAKDFPIHQSILQEGKLAHDLRYLASVVSQSFLAFGDILQLYVNFQKLSGNVARVHQIHDLFQSSTSSFPFAESKGANASSNSSLLSNSLNLNESTVDKICFDKVNIVTPRGKLLARHLSVEVSKGKNLLVTGPNGSGKTSIFRVLAGLWPITSGKITVSANEVGPMNSYQIINLGNKDRSNQGTLLYSESPESQVNSVGESSQGVSEEIFCVCQRPYCPMGTLRDQIIYPLTLPQAVAKLANGNGMNGSKWPNVKVDDLLNVLDEKLSSILEDVRLSYLLEREGWKKELKWEEVLSLGEQQRLGMARLFFHRPKFAVLDECTNATSVEIEERLYKKAKDFGITVITNSQRPALIPHHSMELRMIDGEGEWQLFSINPNTLD